MHPIILIISSIHPYKKIDFNKVLKTGDDSNKGKSGMKNCRNEIGRTAINPNKQANSWCENFNLNPNVKINKAAIKGTKQSINPNIILKTPISKNQISKIPMFKDTVNIGF